MKILVTGSSGFIGKNLCLSLEYQGYEVYRFDVDNTKSELRMMIKNCDFIMHLAGINRPLAPEEFYDGNVRLTQWLVQIIEEERKTVPLLFSSTIQAEQFNDYGKSKRQAEEVVSEYALRTGSDIFIYRLANAFGKWCRPNYNSQVATFCHMVANDLDFKVTVPNAIVPLVYIDDIVHSFMTCIGKPGSMEVQEVDPTYKISVGKLADTIKSFKDYRENKRIQYDKSELERKLYTTYLSYVPEEKLIGSLGWEVDAYDFLKSDSFGKLSIRYLQPGEVSGNHWHGKRSERYVVVAGCGKMKMRRIGSEQIIEHHLSREKIQVVDIPVGYVHSIENIGDSELVLLVWSEAYEHDRNSDIFEEQV